MTEMEFLMTLKAIVFWMGLGSYFLLKHAEKTDPFILTISAHLITTKFGEKALVNVRRGWLVVALIAFAHIYG